MLSLDKSHECMRHVRVDETNIRVTKSESCLSLAQSDLSRYLRHVAIEGTANKIIIAEDEGLLYIETDGDDVLGVLFRKFVSLFDFEFMLE